jgi:hypothetical protein
MKILKIRFESKSPHTTNWLRIDHPEGLSLQPLEGDINAIGWVRSPIAPSPLNGVETVSFNRGGGGPFGGWTDHERPKIMLQIRRVLAKHGFTAIPVVKLTMADCI